MLVVLIFFYNCRWVDSGKGNDMVDYSHAVVPNIPAGISGTALAASLLRDGWSVSYFWRFVCAVIDLVPLLLFLHS